MIQSPYSKLMLWITKQDQLPDICIDCGVFTDRRVKAKGVAFRTEWTAESEPVVLGCFLALLGPLGWLISLGLSSDQVKHRKKEVKVKDSIKVPQCEFCRAESPLSPIELDWTCGQFAFHVHDRFKSEFERVNHLD